MYVCKAKPDQQCQRRVQQLTREEINSINANEQRTQLYRCARAKEGIKESGKAKTSSSSTQAGRRSKGKNPGAAG